MFSNLVKLALANGGKIRPLVLPRELTQGTGLCNPSVYIDGDQILVNVRHVQYNLYSSEFQEKFESRWGPMTYMHPENDPYLRTVNYLCKLDEELNITQINRVDTSRLDVPPIWDFVGLEDGRVVRWDNKLYLIGVRRDTTPDGQGRMEFTEVKEYDGQVKEISRTRIQAPSDFNSYCEKNWMPIIDMPFHMIKWSNPTEVVKIDLATNSSKTVVQSNKLLTGVRDLRGGSQVIAWGDHYIAITHEVDLWNNEPGNKDGRYYHRIVVWDKNWDIVKASTDFNFMDGGVEFSCGLATWKDKVLITFGYHDNAAYILEVPNTFIEEFINGHTVTANS